MEETFAALDADEQTCPKTKLNLHFASDWRVPHGHEGSQQRPRDELHVQTHIRAVSVMNTFML